MGFLAWLGVGAIAGLLAKLIMPGNDPGGFIVTILIGIAGGFIGGFIGRHIGIGEMSGFNIGTILTATAGAILLLVVYRFVRKKQ